MEILTFISAILGVIAALLNRKRIIVLRYERADSAYPYAHAARAPVTVRKRFKRMLIAFAFAVAMPIFTAMLGDDSNRLRDIFIWPFGICLLAAGYQFCAAIILIVAKLWR